MSDRFIATSDFNYHLPADRIAVYPLQKRDESKLLIYKNDAILENLFKNLASILPSDSLLVFNETKVIPARLIFTSETGAQIEIFCLEKEPDSTENKQEQWLCYVGKAAKWKQKTLSQTLDNLQLSATIIEKKADAFSILFEWNDTDRTFLEVLEILGKTPLPPYIKRKAEEKDKETYQTVFSKYEGSVAAPTAGLHFTKEVLHELDEKKIDKTAITLHVGAGTFKPIKSENALAHEMHPEWIDVSIESIEKLALKSSNNIIPIGTTALRTIETLYWLGVKALENKLQTHCPIYFSQWEYEALSQNISREDAFSSLYDFMQKNNWQNIVAQTQIMITPFYQIRSANAIITNFHQPESTLLLLISAFVGEKWKTIYDYALQNDFRFLSYGDSSLLFLHKKGDKV